MLRLTPSEVVAIIERALPWSREPFNAVSRSDGPVRVGTLSGISAAVDSIRPELITLTGEDLGIYVAATGALRTLCAGAEPHVGLMLSAAPQYGGFNEVAAIHRCLKECPDQIPSPHTAELSFLPSGEFRDNLRLDLSTCNSALVNREWKACTVVAGSIAEALLLWSLQQHKPSELESVLMAEQKAGRVDKGLKIASIEKWYLGDYTALALALKDIEDTTATQTGLLREYRNLIHAGRAQRLGQRCDRGTSLAAVSAIEAIAADLEK